MLESLGALGKPQGKRSKTEESSQILQASRTTGASYERTTREQESLEAREARLDRQLTKGQSPLKRIAVAEKASD